MKSSEKKNQSNKRKYTFTDGHLCTLWTKSVPNHDSGKLFLGPGSWHFFPWWPFSPIFFHWKYFIQPHCGSDTQMLEQVHFKEERPGKKPCWQIKIDGPCQKLSADRSWVHKQVNHTVTWRVRQGLLWWTCVRDPHNSLDDLHSSVHLIIPAGNCVHSGADARNNDTAPHSPLSWRHSVEIACNPGNTPSWQEKYFKRNLVHFEEVWVSFFSKITLVISVVLSDSAPLSTFWAFPQQPFGLWIWAIPCWNQENKLYLPNKVFSDCNQYLVRKNRHKRFLGKKIAFWWFFGNYWGFFWSWCTQQEIRCAAHSSGSY